MVPEDIDRVVPVLLDLLKVGAGFYPPLAVASPFISAFVRFEAMKLKHGLADGSLISDGRGGVISREWADDPRHQLNPDGTFKF